jgi:hypothetical protein
VQGGLDDLLTSGLSYDAWGSPHEDYSQALTFVQHAALLLKQYEKSGVLAELEEGINAITIANQLTCIPENHPMKPGRLSNLGNGLCGWFERLCKDY